MQTIPVLLLTGYLGSGKTTLVNRILNNRKGIKFAVIVNDIGEVNIDAELIEKGGVVGKRDDSLVSLQNGCICCTLKMDLVEQLREVAAMRKFDYIVIEASGICEPDPIARTICSIPYMGAEYAVDGMARLDCIVTVVDALRMKDEFACAKNLLGNFDEEDIENLVIQQIEFCNIILLNKASELSKEELGKVKEIVKALQPVARIIECDYGDVDLDLLLNTGLFDYESVSGSAAWVRAVEGRDEEDHHDHDDDDDDDHDGHEHHHHDNDDDKHEHHHHDHDDDDDDDDEEEHGHHHHHHHHHHGEGETEEYGIGTYVYQDRRPLDINKFDNFVARHWPLGIIRAKGICYFASEPDLCYLFEQAGSQVSLKNIGQWYATMPEEELNDMLRTDEALQRDWDSEYGDRMQKLVFIGQNLDREEIRKAIDFCLQG